MQSIYISPVRSFKALAKGLPRKSLTYKILHQAFVLYRKINRKDRVSAVECEQVLSRINIALKNQHHLALKRQAKSLNFLHFVRHRIRQHHSLLKQPGS